MALETWFVKSLLATVSIVPSFIAIPFFKHKFGIDPLVFVVWYFGGTAMCTAAILVIGGRGGELLPTPAALIAIIAIGMIFGAMANGLLFQAVGLAPNPGLPPVVYATSSVIVFVLSALLATSFPALFRPVSADFSRLIGVVLVLGGLYLLAGGKIANPLRALT
jgi:hypothetical protein